MSDDRELREALERAQAARKSAAAALEKALAREQQLEQQAARAEGELEALVPRAESTQRELDALREEVWRLRQELAPTPQVIKGGAAAPVTRPPAPDRALARLAGAATGAALCLLIALLALGGGAGEAPDCTGALGFFCVIMLPAHWLAEGFRLLIGGTAATVTVVLLGVCVKAALQLRKGAVSSAT